MTYGQLSDALRAAITATLSDSDAEENWVYVCDFSDTFVVYEVGYGNYLQDDYTFDGDAVKLAGNPQPVQSVTTYVPVPESEALFSALENRGIRVASGANGFERRTDKALKDLRLQRDPSPVRITYEPLTYDERAPRSYFADLLLADKYPSRSERLERHNAEMRVINAERDQNALREIRAGGFEYRVEPSRTPGFGGYFTPPLWMNQWFATAKRSGRVLAGLMPHFALPSGVASINLPILTTGTKVRHQVDNEGVSGQDITDSSGFSTVATMTGQADVALQMLEQSPQGAYLDWALLLDMAGDYDRDVETQLLTGQGSAYDELLGVVNADTVVTYTDSSPTASEMWTYFGQMAGGIGDNRDLPPEAYLMRTARWSWLQTQEDTAGRPFGVPTPFYLGSDDETPDPAGGLISWPVFLDDAIPANLGAGANQDLVICLRPSDLILLEGQPETNIFKEVLSGSLGVRIQMHNRVAAVTNRYTAGIYCLEGTGMVVPSGF